MNLQPVEKVLGQWPDRVVIRAAIRAPAFGQVDQPMPPEVLGNPFGRRPGHGQFSRQRGVGDPGDASVASVHGIAEHDGERGPNQAATVLTQRRAVPLGGLGEQPSDVLAMDLADDQRPQDRQDVGLEALRVARPGLGRDVDRESPPWRSDRAPSPWRRGSRGPASWWSTRGTSPARGMPAACPSERATPCSSPVVTAS
jgi:hypothetical protein